MKFAKHSVLAAMSLALLPTFALAGPGYGYPWEYGTWISTVGRAHGSHRRHARYKWSLVKKADPLAIELRKHKSAKINFRLIVTRELEREVKDTTLDGEICVTNPGPYPTAGLKISGIVQARNGDDWIDVEGARHSPTIETQLEPGQTKCFPHKLETPLADGPEYRYRASATITNFQGHAGEEFGADAMAPLSYKDELVTTESGREALLTDVFVCPPGLTCVAPPFREVLNGPAAIDYPVTVTNEKLGRGHLLLLNNHATLSVHDECNSEHKASVAVVVNTGARRCD